MIDKNTGKPYKPTPAYFIGCFDTYDREETLGKTLNKYNPNDMSDRKYLIKTYSIGKKQNLSYKHKWLLFKSLEDALNCSDYDFQSILKNDENELFFLPWEWDIKDPRGFFEEILKIAKEEWKDDLEKASKEDPSTW